MDSKAIRVTAYIGKGKNKQVEHVHEAYLTKHNRIGSRTKNYIESALCSGLKLKIRGIETIGLV
jgi:hypothetical protein